MIHDRLPECPYQDLNVEQKMLVDAGIYIAANRLAHADFIFQELMDRHFPDKKLIQSLSNEISSLAKCRQPAENSA